MNPPKQSNTYRFMQERPRLGARVFIHPSAVVNGAVTLGDDVSVWPMAVIRGDVGWIAVGAGSNIQDCCVLHVTHESVAKPEGGPLVIGREVTVGHAAILHACTIGDRCLIGMGAIVMDDVEVGADSLIAGGSVVTPGTKVPPGTLWRGNPARQARELSPEDMARQAYSAAHYVRLKNLCLAEQGSETP